MICAGIDYDAELIITTYRQEVALYIEVTITEIEANMRLHLE